jgi:hypothetical protein
VIGLIGRLTAHVSRLSTAARLAWLNGALLVVLCVALSIAAARDGAAGFTAVLVAALVCTLSANAALVLATLWHGKAQGVAGALAGTLVGMLPPLAIGFTLQRQGGELARAGVFGWIVVFYQSALIVKTLLVAPVSATAGRATSGTSKVGA